MRTRRILQRKAQRLLLAQRADAGQNLALEQLQRSTAAGGAERKFICYLKLLGRRYGVTTANDGDAIGLCQALSDSLGTLGKGIQLEYAQRTVPKNRLCTTDDVAELFDGFVANVDTHATLGDFAALFPRSSAACLCPLLKLEGVAGVCRQYELHALGSGIGKNLVSKVKLVGLNLGVAYVLALGSQEGVGHSPADDESLALLHELGEHLNLVGNLGTAHNHDEGLSRCLEFALEVLKLVLDKEPHGTLLGIMCYTLGGGVSAVSGTECIVYIKLGIAKQGLCKLGVVLLLFLVETHVVQQQHVAVLQSSASSSCRVTDGFRHKGYRLTQVAGKAFGSSFQRELCLITDTFGATEVRAKNKTSTVVEQVLDGGQSGNDTSIVGDYAVLHGDVKVHTHKDFLTGNVEVAYSQFSHIVDVCCCLENEQMPHGYTHGEGILTSFVRYFKAKYRQQAEKWTDFFKIRQNNLLRLNLSLTILHIRA